MLMYLMHLHAFSMYSPHPARAWCTSPHCARARPRPPPPAGGPTGEVMRDNIWDDDDGAGRRSRARSTTLIVLATIPWLVVAAIIFLPDRGSDDHVPPDAISTAPPGEPAPDEPLLDGSTEEAGRETATSPPSVEPYDP